MLSSNNFNVCPHCGKANSLNARYCSSCGKQLTVPEEVIVCHKCHRPNSPMSSFCGTCGAPLHDGSQTKICPNCHEEVDVKEYVCSKCGHRFSGVGMIAPDPNASVTPVDGKKKKKINNKGKGKGRVIAVFALIFLLMFAYLAFMPANKLRPVALSNFDKGMINVEGDETPNKYGFDLIYSAVKTFMSTGGNVLAKFTSIANAYGAGGAVMTYVVIVFALVAVVHLLVCLVRIFSGKRSKRGNIFFLIMAIIATIWAGLTFGLSFVKGGGFLAKVAHWFVPVNCKLGLVFWLVPIYFWFFYIYSLLAKKKKMKETTV